MVILPFITALFVNYPLSAILKLNKASYLKIAVITALPPWTWS